MTIILVPYLITFPGLYFDVVINLCSNMEITQYHELLPFFCTSNTFLSKGEEKPKTDCVSLFCPSTKFRLRFAINF